jgi:ketosteroid isomerase-like protein
LNLHGVLRPVAAGPAGWRQVASLCDQNDKVVSLVYSEATVRDTGRSFVNPEAHVWTIRDGKLARFQSYHDTAAAASAHRVE